VAVEQWDIVVAGGGLAGLTAASRLQDRAVVLEKESLPGGLLRSPSRDGFVIDLLPHVFFTGNVEALAFFRATVGTGRFFRRRSDIRVFSHSTVTRFPFQCSLHGLPKEVILECLDAFANRPTLDHGVAKDFHEFVTASFGAGMARHFMAPYNRKLWGVSDLKELTAEWVGGKVVTIDVEDVVEGAVRDRRFSRIPNDFFRYPKRGGIQDLTDRLAARTVGLRLQSEIVKLDLEARVVVTADGREIGYRSLISTLPLDRTIALAGPGVSSDVQHAARALRFRDVYGLRFGIARERIVPWHWLYFPEPEFPFYRVSFPSNMSPRTAPPGHSSVLAEVAVNPQAEVDEKALLASCEAAMRRCGILRADDRVVLAECARLSPAYVVYDHARNRAVETLHAYLRERRVLPAGRFGEWRFFNMDHTILSGLRAAEQALTSLDGDG
jgi:UDP-galactopyranose mutase